VFLRGECKNGRNGREVSYYDFKKKKIIMLKILPRVPNCSKFVIIPNT
jgi:hypothetical protein